MKKLAGYRNELLLITCLLAVIGLTSIATISRNPIYLWVSLTAIVGTSFVFAVNFFRENNAGPALVNYLVTGGLLVTYFALIYRNFEISNNLSAAVEPLSWLDAFYFSLVTWTSLGYGDYSPLGQARLWAVAEALIGYFYMALLAGKLISLAQARREAR